MINNVAFKTLDFEQKLFHFLCCLQRFTLGMVDTKMKETAFNYNDMFIKYSV